MFCTPIYLVSASDLGMYRFFQFRPLNLKISVSLEPLMGTHYAAVHNILRLLISENGNPLSTYEFVRVNLRLRDCTWRVNLKNQTRKNLASLLQRQIMKHKFWVYFEYKFVFHCWRCGEDTSFLLVLFFLLSQISFYTNVSDEIKCHEVNSDSIIYVSKIHAILITMNLRLPHWPNRVQRINCKRMQ